MDKKLYLAQLAAKAMSCYSDEDVVCDSLWLMNGGISGPEEQWENFLKVFKDTFGISYDEAKQLNLFEKQ